METIKTDLVTPEKRIFSEAVEMVEIPGTEGDFGVLPGHAPFVSAIRAGVVTFHLGGGATRKVFVAGGLAEVSESGCVILAEREVDLSTITPANAQARIADAQKALDQAGNDTQKSQAEADLRLAEAIAQALAA